MSFLKKIKERLFFVNNSPFKYIYLFINKIISKNKYRKSYSQGAMDLILKDIFKNKIDGIYVDVGAQHPIKNNNTYQLYKKGWRGINIDLDNMNIELFKYNRPNDFNVCEAVSNRVEEVDLFFYHHKSPINTLVKEISDKQNSKLNEIKKVKTATLNNILEKTNINRIDLLTIDVEGNELKVLKGLNFDKFLPKLIIVEYLDINSQKWEIPYNNIENIMKSEIYNFIISKNYKFVNWVNGDLVFVSKKFKV